MLEWLTGRRKRKELPEYSALRSVPSRGLPTELEEKERSEAFTTRRETLQRELLERPRRPLDDEPLFTALLDTDDGGVLTITEPESEDRCVPVFSTPFRAADYKQTLLTGSPRLSYLASTPRDFIGMLRDLEEVRSMIRTPTFCLLRLLSASEIRRCLRRRRRFYASSNSARGRKSLTKSYDRARRISLAQSSARGHQQRRGSRCLNRLTGLAVFAELFRSV